MGSTQVLSLNGTEQTIINNNNNVKTDLKPRRFVGLCWQIDFMENLPLSFSDVTKDKTSHIISKETPGMEKAMTEYIAYKAGKRKDPVAHLKGANHIFDQPRVFLQDGRLTTPCTW